MYIDVSQQESAVALMGGELLAYQMTGEEPERIGNRSRWYAPCNTYPCAGEDRWITIAVTSDEEWAWLVTAMGAEGLASDHRFATAEQRLANQDDLDAVIGGWTRGLDAFDLAKSLQAAGVPAGPVLKGPDLLADRHYADRGTFVTVDHPQVGPKQYPGLAWKMSGTPGEIRSPAPTLGQHNRAVYCGLLGMDEGDIDVLESGGVIGTKPTGSRII